MGTKSETSALSALSAPERGEVLSSLLRAHPSLVAEAERVAAGLLGGADRGRVAGDVAGALRALHLRDLAERAGPQWGGGYVDPGEAADELLAEVVELYLDDLDRRARRQARGAATEIGLGLLARPLLVPRRGRRRAGPHPFGHARLRRPPRHAGNLQDCAARA